MGFDRFLQAHVALFLRAHSLGALFFLIGSSAHDVHVIFLFHAIILSDVLETGFLLFARHYSFFLLSGD